MYCILWFSSIQFSHSVVSNSLRPLESQHARPPCPSPTPGVYSNSCPLSRWCHPAISSSVIPFSSCPQSLPASGSFPMSQLFTWGGQSIGVSASVLTMNTLSIISCSCPTEIFFSSQNLNISLLIIAINEIVGEIIWSLFFHKIHFLLLLVYLYSSLLYF